MTPWPPPFVPRLPGQAVPVRVHDTASGTLVPAASGTTARMYVCGITPYDATHVGHAATYLAFDLLLRAWLDAGLDVTYVQNVTDVDDPLLERARATGEDWRSLADRETALFAEDMTALCVLPPDFYVGAVEAIPLIVPAIETLLDDGNAYTVTAPGAVTVPGTAGEAPQAPTDVYFDIAGDPGFGTLSGTTADERIALFAERGGDPGRPGKRNRLDPLLWQAERPGEPAWDGGRFGRGRPGWHIECAAIALDRLGMDFDVQGGGSDLAFPHHEMSAAHAQVLTGKRPFARAYVHAGMVGLDGRKMSKSEGNLVFVSSLRAEGVEPAALRLALLASHYRSDRNWTPELLATARRRMSRWRDGLSRQNGPDATPVLEQVRLHLADDLDSPAALAAIDAWVDEQLALGGPEPGSPGVVARTADALLGVRL